MLSTSDRCALGWRAATLHERLAIADAMRPAAMSATAATEASPSLSTASAGRAAGVLHAPDAALLADAPDAAHVAVAATADAAGASAREPDPDSVLRAWQQAFAPGDPDALRRRLAWDELDEAGVRRALERTDLAALSALPPPAWTDWLTRIAAHAPRVAEEWSHGTLPDRAALRLESDPLLAVAIPILRATRDAFAEQAGDAAATLPDEARAAFERLWLREIVSLGALSLQELWRAARPAPAAVAGREAAPASSPMSAARRAAVERIEQRAFVIHLLRQGLVPLWQARPVLARHIALVTQHAAAAAAEMLVRLAQDRARLVACFAHGADPGALVAVEPGLSDPHDHRRRVAVLTFASGLRLVYKPRDLQLERQYNLFLAWTAARGLAPAPRAIAVLPRETYGWVEFVAHEPCRSQADVRDAFHRGGSLLCLTWLLGGRDLHVENVIATRQGPVLIDTEMLLQPSGSLLSDATPLTAGTEARATSDTAGAGGGSSCLETGLLSWLQPTEAGTIDIGGLRGDRGLSNRIRLDAAADAREHIDADAAHPRGPAGVNAIVASGANANTDANVNANANANAAASAHATTNLDVNRGPNVVENVVENVVARVTAADGAAVNASQPAAVQEPHEGVADVPLAASLDAARRAGANGAGPHGVLSAAMNRAAAVQGVLQRPEDYIEDLLGGFTAMYRLLLAHRTDLLASDGPLARFGGCRARVAFRPSAHYASVHQVLSTPAFLRGGVMRSCALDSLSRLFNTDRTRPRLWPLVSAERRALEALDVPRFTIRVNDVVVDEGRAVGPLYARSGLAAAGDRLTRLAEPDLAWHLATLRDVLADTPSSRFHCDPPPAPPGEASPAPSPARPSDAANAQDTQDAPRAARAPIEPRAAGAPSASSVVGTARARTDSRAADEPAEPDARRALYVDHAVWIGRELIARARVDDGSLTWPLHRWQHASAAEEVEAFGLYGGALGPALCFAALAAVTGEPHWATAARGVLAPLRGWLDRAPFDADPAARGRCAIGIGGGLGSIAYGLLVTSRLLDDDDLRLLAWRAAGHIRPERIACDRALDVTSGAAGTLLALLALLDDADAPAPGGQHLVPTDAAPRADSPSGMKRGEAANVVEQRGVREQRGVAPRGLERPALEEAARAQVEALAEACVERLLATQTPRPGGAGWPVLDGCIHTGFAHGAAGIAYALLRHVERTGRDDCRDAALRAWGGERVLYAPSRGEWPVLDVDTAALPRVSAWMTAWCHGAPGIALARGLTRHLVEDEASAAELRAAVGATLARRATPFDSLCCGNFGRLDVLLTLGLHLQRPDLRAAAHDMAAAAIGRARRRAHWTLTSSGFEYRVFDPGYFQGLSGIGYQLLRLAAPTRLPSVLAFETARTAMPASEDARTA